MSTDNQPVTDTPGVILAKILKTILYQLGVNVERYQYFMFNFIKQLDLNSNYKISSVINNVSKEVFNASISWKVFIKAMLFLGTSRLVIFLRVAEDRPMVQHEIDLTDRNLASNLFCFSNKEEAKEEVQLGRHLKEFLDDIIVKNSLTPVYSEAIDNYISQLKQDQRYRNKSLKGNLAKELKLNNISWKVFIKTLAIYRIVNPTIGVTIHDRNGKHHTVSFNVNLDDLVV
jgi:hypothetical protein